MTKIELLEMLTKYAKEFRKDTTSVSRNVHLTNMKEEPSQEAKDAILVSFINFVGYKQCIDYALATEDLNKE